MALFPSLLLVVATKFMYKHKRSLPNIKIINVMIDVPCTDKNIINALPSICNIFIVMLDIKNEPLELNHTAKPLYFLFFPLNGCIQSTLCILKRKETIGKNQLKIYFMVMGFGKRTKIIVYRQYNSSLD